MSPLNRLLPVALVVAACAASPRADTETAGDAEVGTAADSTAADAPNDSSDDLDAPADDVPPGEVSGPDDVPPPIDVPPDTPAPDVVEDVGPPPPPKHAPDDWGPYAVGLYVETFYDEATDRALETMIWYPANKAQEDSIAYFGLLPGQAIEEPSPNAGEAPYPLVLFSHGFQGINFQSFAILEYIASHGYVVASGNHPGNTFFDFSATDEQVAAVATARPGDVLYVMGEVLEMAGKEAGYLSGMVDPTRVAISGHSFGGWTALVIAGGVVDIDTGKAQCAAGAEADVMCPYIEYWEAGATIALDEPLPGLKAAIYFAPGGVAAFPAGALDGIGVPSLITGGTKDHMIPVDTEIDPLYALLPSPKTRVIVEGASHMTWTNICDVPFAAAFLPEFCEIEGVIGKDAGFAIARTLSTAFLGLHVKGEAGMASYLTDGYLAQKYPEVAIDSE